MREGEATRGGVGVWGNKTSWRAKWRWRRRRMRRGRMRRKCFA
jgi:hypothetical protein